ncbi:MAG: glycosyltransferase family 9 protein [Nitrospinota bacterium]
MKEITIPKDGKLLLIKPSSMGDIIQAFPFVTTIANERPDIKIDWIANEYYVELVRLNKNVRNLLTFRRSSFLELLSIEELKKLIEFAQSIKADKYDIVVDLQGLARSGLMTLIARSNFKIGYSNARECSSYSYDLKVNPIANSLDVDRYLSILSYLNISLPSEVDWGIKIPQNEIEAAANLTSNQPYIVMNPNSRWASKQWPIEKFEALADMINDKFNFKIVLIGSQFDITTVQKFNPRTAANIIDLTGKTSFALLAAILKESKLLITADSGPMHLGVAVKVKVVSLFGPTNPQLTGPYNNKDGVISVDCKLAPCYKRKCPIELNCLDAIEVASVFEKVNSLLAQVSDC